LIFSAITIKRLIDIHIRDTIYYMVLDPVDQEICRLLQENGRMTFADIAQRVGLTAAPVLARVNKLEAAGVIGSYHAVLGREKLGFAMTAFVAVILKSHGTAECRDFVAAIVEVPEVLECHHIAGEEDYLLKVVAQSPKDYERLINDRITNLPQVRRVKTILVLSSAKESTAVPVKVNP